MPGPVVTSRLPEDVILRSVEGTDLYANKLLLSIASPFFETMFTLPQSSEFDHDPELTKGGIPIIPMAETSETLKLLLAFCSPRWHGQDPAPTSLTVIQSLIDAALKYDMEGVTTHALEFLLSPQFLSSEPMRIVAIACKYKWERGVTKAALSTLCQFAPAPFAHELKYMTGAQYHRLQTYRKACVEVALVCVLESRVLACDDSFICGRCVTYPASSPNSLRPQSLKCQWLMEIWADYDAMLRVMPCGLTVKCAVLFKVIKDRGNVIGCKGCRENAMEGLTRFNLKLAADIEDAIAKVNLVVSF